MIITKGGENTINNETIQVAVDTLTAGIDLCMTPPILYGVIIGIAVIGVSIVGKWFRMRKTR